jgi:large subunit ribosomal protein L28
MSRVCAICGKGKMAGHQVSHSNIKTNREYNANVQKVKIDIDGKTSRQYVCTRCLKAAKKEAK